MTSIIIEIPFTAILTQKNKPRQLATENFEKKNDSVESYQY
jgi:hypothetical protein